MDYYALLDLVITLGHRLAMAGAETFRVEECVNRILKSYGIEAEAFVIPNCMTVSIKTETEKPMTRMRRIGDHDNDLDAVERYSNLSRRICAEVPDPQTALQWLAEADRSRRYYGIWGYLIGHFLGGCGFAVLYGGTFLDGILSGFCGLAVGAVAVLMNKIKANPFFRIIITSYIMSLFAYALAAFGLAHSADTVIIGALMLLVPGLLFTNAMRDIINGDTNSGMNRIIQVFLISAAIALGTGAAWQSATFLWQQPINVPVLIHSFPVCFAACFVGCTGFSILFNIHGPGGLLCSLGGALCWAVYFITTELTGSDLSGYFFASVFASTYAEVMARIRKYPAISYLVVSLFPLLPGASVYYTVNHAVRGDIDSFANQGIHTIAIAGLISVGVLLISTTFRGWSIWQRNRKLK